MHPLIDDLSSLKTSVLEEKINELSKKYFLTNNYNVQHQIQMILDVYKIELSKRRANELEKMMETRNKDLDKLINVN